MLHFSLIPLKVNLFRSWSLYFLSVELRDAEVWYFTSSAKRSQSLRKWKNEATIVFLKTCEQKVMHKLSNKIPWRVFGNSDISTKLEQTPMEHKMCLHLWVQYVWNIECKHISYDCFLLFMKTGTFKHLWGGEAVESFTATREFSFSLSLRLHACFVYICKCRFATSSSVHVTCVETARLWSVSIQRSWTFEGST